MAGQIQGEEHTAWSADFLFEKKVGMGGAFTIEAEWARYSQLGLTSRGFDTTDGGYVLGSYLFPSSDSGKWEILGKYASANRQRLLLRWPVKRSMTTTEFNLNYIIKQFNARLMMFFLDKRFELLESANSWKIGARSAAADVSCASSTRDSRVVITLSFTQEKTMKLKYAHLSGRRRCWRWPRSPAPVQV